MKHNNIDYAQAIELLTQAVQQLQEQVKENIHKHNSLVLDLPKIFEGMSQRLKKLEKNLQE